MVRCDFNVPLSDGKITDNTRIKAAIPTIQYLVEQGAKIMLCSHLGRPKGEVNKKYSLQPVANELSQELNTQVKFANDVVGDSAKNMADSLKEGEVGLLENVRFEPGEEKNDDTLAIELSELVGENGVYVNDAFGTAHRAHSSTAGVADKVRQRGGEAVAGLLMEKEVKELGCSIRKSRATFCSNFGWSESFR